MAALFRDFYDRNSWFTDHMPGVAHLARDWNNSQSAEFDQEVWKDVKKSCAGRP